MSIVVGNLGLRFGCPAHVWLGQTEGAGKREGEESLKMSPDPSDPCLGELSVITYLRI